MPPGAVGFERSDFTVKIKIKPNKIFSDRYLLFLNLPATTQMLSLSLRRDGEEHLSALSNKEKSQRE